jgi:hypothetical protein
MKKLLTIMSAAFLLASCSKSANEVLPTDAISASETEEGALKKDCNDDNGKPFKGSLVYHYTESFNLPCNCGSFADAGNYFGTGNLTHLGNSTSKIKPCIALIFSGSAPIGVHVGQECGSFKAANGDEIYTSVAPYDMYFNSTGGAAGTLVVTFAGGTGKFKKASGSFTGYTTNDGMGTVTLDVLSGNINY